MSRLRLDKTRIQVLQTWDTGANPVGDIGDTSWQCVLNDAVMHVQKMGRYSRRGRLLTVNQMYQSSVGATPTRPIGKAMSKRRKRKSKDCGLGPHQQVSPMARGTVTPSREGKQRKLDRKMKQRGWPD